MQCCAPWLNWVVYPPLKLLGVILRETLHQQQHLVLLLRHCTFQRSANHILHSNLTVDPNVVCFLFLITGETKEKKFEVFFIIPTYCLYELGSSIGNSRTILWDAPIPCPLAIQPRTQKRRVFLLMRHFSCHLRALAGRISNSGAPAARRAAKRSPIVITGKKRKPMKDFLMVIMASGIARGRVRTTTTTTESRNMAAIIQKIG